MSSTFKSKEKEVIVAKSQLAQTHKELISLANLLNAASTKPNNASTKKEITNLYARYTKSTSTFEQRKQKLFQALAAITAFSDECNRRLKELNDSSNSELFNTYRQLKDVVINMINEIKDKSCILVKIDFMTDFTEFINKHHICFIDVSPVRFDKFVFSNRFIAPESSLIPRFKMEYFPFFLCTVLHDFTSSEDNELSVSKDMRLFLMEKPKCEWALVMKPKYAECGFVPFSFINVIGYGVAVVAEPGSDVFDVGTIVAIMEEENGQIMCEDVYGNSALLPKSQLIVLEVP
ncbi:hypothetical protein GPJ56_000934 [Histomonas meleagridis]|uniref:uncharacterized protein n=1 Tax=Histomonas meleagridis TaxID=135588 RepID=UPI0035594F9C|nr:hypothetical protein GPJ56_000934 [Histomonas meleagridis]KAH0803769.1 hypothetical protein GO595_002599 [Histomonas meleagridis]